MDIIFLYLMSFVLGYWIYKKYKEWQNLLPGPWGLPIVGFLPFLDRHQPHASLTKLSQKYGPIYGITMGTIYAVVLSDHKLVREALAKDSFTGRAPLYLTHGIFQGNGIVCAEGGLWKDQRKLITGWLKSFGMGKHGTTRDNLEKRIATGAHELIEELEKQFGTSIDLNHITNNYLGNVINEIVFGYKYPAHDKTWQWSRQIQEDGCNEMGVAGAVNFLPFLRFFSSTLNNTIDFIKRGQAQTFRLYASIIRKRRNLMGIERPAGAEYPPHANLFQEHPQGFIKCVTYGKKSDTTEHYFDPAVLIPYTEECILDSFLLEQKKRFEEGNELSKYTTDLQLFFLLADMFGAGLDTTAVTLAWFFLYMALYPDEQEIVRQEIISVYPQEDIVDIAKLPRLMAAISETMRIRSIVPVGIPHGCLQETQLANYRIPKGTMIIPLLWAMHMDPAVWENPEEFKPSRFIDKDGSLLKPREFIPFQTGKRMCPGDELARMIAGGFAARLFRRLRLRLAGDPPSEGVMRGSVGVTLAPPKVYYICESI